MNVLVYTRHSADCPKRLDRFYRRCDCPKWFQYQHHGRQIRSTAETRSWETASAKARELETRLETGLPATKAAPITVEDAIKKYLASKQTDGECKESAMRKQTSQMAKLKDWCDSKGIVYLKDVTADTLSDWRNTWNLKKHADGTLSPSWKIHWSISKAIFTYGVTMGWLPINEAAKLKSFRTKTLQVQPFSKPEMKSILAAVEQCEWDKHKTEKVLTFILLLRWSGLAIQDAACLRRSALDNQDRLNLARKKTDEGVFVLLPATVANRLRELPKDNAEYFFWNGTTGRESVAVLYREYLNDVFEKAGIDGHPHQFRHTFAVENLLAGVPLETVSKLLGHKNVATTEKYYLAWIPERQQKLEHAVRASLAVQEMI